MTTSRGIVNILGKNINKETEYINTDSTYEMSLPYKKKYSETMKELVYQLVKQNSVLSKTRKKFYKIQSLLDKEEITSRYIKDELKNIQLELKQTNENLDRKKVELVENQNKIISGCVLMYILSRIYYYIF
jgi:Fe2+ transport system protein B